MDETPTEPQPSRRRRRRTGRPGGPSQNPEGAAPDSPPGEAADAAPETAPPEAAAVEYETECDADYADSSAFHRFSGALGVRAAALVLFSVQGSLTRNAVVLLIVAALLGAL